MSQKGFIGHWCVCEYVFDPQGLYLGNIVQERKVKTSSARSLRITQICEVEKSLLHHPIASFAGEWVFSIDIDDPQLRVYQGPDVIGFGLPLGERTMIGQGIWPRLGFHFQSYATMVSPERQLTGGTFSKAGRIVADIVGIGIPLIQENTPTLELNQSPHDISKSWKGVRHTFDAKGQKLSMASIQRRHVTSEKRIEETDEKGYTRAFHITDPEKQAYLQTLHHQTFHGFYRDCGPLRRLQSIDSQQNELFSLELFDAQSGHLVVLNKHLHRTQIMTTEVTYFQASSHSTDES